MTERTDHAHCALAWVKHAHSPDGADKNAAELLQVAQVHATLALVEQQRIANLIALSQACDGNGWQAQEPLSSVFAYKHPDPEDGFEGLHVRPEILEALGI